MYEDLKAAKQILSGRLLKRSALANVIAFQTSRIVAEAVARASVNVHAVGIGYKVSEGHMSDTLCVRLHVVQKLAESLIPPAELLPKEIDGVPTDVIESAPAFLLGRAAVRRSNKKPAKLRPEAAGSAPSCTERRMKKQRPMVAGISTAVHTVTAGTLGAFCGSTKAGDDPGTVFMLSNNHVFADVNKAAIGEDIYQPGPQDGGTSADAVADLYRFVPLALGGTLENKVDCAIANVRAGVQFAPEICSIGRLTGPVPASPRLKVRKHGRTTGLTQGEVSDIDYDALIGMDHNDPNIVAKFAGQIRLEPLGPSLSFGKGGDSGSLVVSLDDPPRAVGLFFAGSQNGEYGLANPIDDVLRELQIQLL